MTGHQHQFVVFSDDWGRHPSSSQHLFTHISRDHRVLWVNTVGLRAPKPDKFTLLRAGEKFREWLRPLRQICDNMWVLAPIMAPINGNGWAGKANTRITTSAIRRAMQKLNFDAPILWASVPTAADYIGKLDESALVYYVTDDYRLWPGANTMKIQHADHELTQSADLIFACSEPLADGHRTGLSETLLLNHAVDLDHFTKTRPQPPDLADIPHPRACFFGLIYEKVDLDCLHELASQMPQLQLLMIGPVKTNVDRLTAMPNVHFLGPKPYTDLPAYLQAMDALLIPYILDDETTSKGPLKIRECLATGKPTVARTIPDLRQFADVVYLYDDRSGFIEATKTALTTQDPNLTRRMHQRIRSETWQNRVHHVLGRIDELTNGSPKPRSKSQNVITSTKPPPWNEFLARHPQASIFHDPRWGKVMKEAYDNRSFYLTAYRNGRVVGILQLVEQRSTIFGSHLSSLPYFDTAGILADDDRTTKALTRKARQLMHGLNVKWVELRQPTPINDDLPTRTDKVTLQLTLPESSDQLWRSLKPKVRNQIRKAQRQGLTTHNGGIELLDDFYAVYTRNMRHLGSPPHGRRFFRLILDRFNQAVRLFVTRSDGRPVAAGFTLTDKHGLHVPWAAGDQRARQLCPNMLLYWSMLDYACRRQVRCFDFGRSTRDSGTYRFKTQWGARELPLYWQYLIPPPGHLPELTPDKSRFRIIAACWRRMPLPLTCLLGPPIIAKLS